MRLHLADWLTLARLPLAAAFWWLADRPAWALTVILVAALTDAVDGRVARLAWRRQGRVGPPVGPGDWLDPLCDKTFVVTVLAAMHWRLGVEAAPLLLVGARELALVPIALAYRLGATPEQRRRVAFRAGPIGKAATLAQFAAIATLLLGWPGARALAVFAGGVGLFAAAHYIVRFFHRSRLAGM